MAFAPEDTVSHEHVDDSKVGDRYAQMLAPIQIGDFDCIVAVLQIDPNTYIKEMYGKIYMMQLVIHGVGIKNCIQN